MIETTKYKDYLKKLKENINSRQVSVLVGAGFSKNVHRTLFLTWEELLFDLVKTLHEEQIKLNYQLLNNDPSPDFTSAAFQDFLQQQIKRHIKESGYLQVVSDYIQRSGYREIIEAYIEERTPKLTYENDKPFLQYRKEENLHKLELTSKELEVHRKLFAIPWINVYTTNYDNLLESCVDLNLHNKLKTIIQDIKDRVNVHENQVNEKEAELLKIRAQLSEFEKKEKEITSESRESEKAQQQANVKKEHSPSNEIKRELEQKSWTYQIEIDQVKGLIKEDKIKVFELHRTLSECYTLVRHSSELALKKSRNIIKLHGSLRVNEGDPFEFDGDIHKCYVIAQEDYDTYPQKHEAFTQLMRISLLQESFCLLGFSGVDMNFLAWIGWVRDIIQRKKGERAEGDYKIFLIDVSTESATSDKRMFYHNHRIARVTLMHEDCIRFLEQETGKKVGDKKSIREVILLFLSYLQDGVSFNLPQVVVEVLHQENYQDRWRKLTIVVGNEFEVKPILEASHFIQNLKKWNRVTNIHYAYSHNKDILLRFANSFLIQVQKQKEKKELLTIILIALEDQLLPYSVYNENNEFDRIIDAGLEIKQLAKSYQLEVLKDAIWNNQFEQAHQKLVLLSNCDDTLLQQEIIYQKALMWAFQLRFTDLKRELISWKPEKHWALKKAGLLALFDQKSATELIKSYEPDSMQEELFRLSILRLINHQFPHQIDREMNEKINNLIQEGLMPIDKNLDYLLDEVNKSKQEVRPYGKGKFSIDRTFSFSNTSKVLESLQFFGHLMETGLPLSIPSLALKPFAKVEPLIRNSFIYYPFPVLFYALQYVNEDFTRKIAQDYTYSEHIEGELNNIASNLEQCWTDPATPAYWKDNLLNFYTEVLIALEPEKWEALFLNVWNYEKEKHFLFRNRKLNKNHFIEKALRYIRSAHVIQQVIIDCTGQIHEESGNVSISFLFILSHNPIFKSLRHELRNEVLEQRIQNLIQSLDTTTMTPLYILGNIDELLNKKEKEEIKNKLAGIKLESIEQASLWQLTCYYTNGDPELLQRIKSNIIYHHLLWHAGIEENGRSSSDTHNFIELHRLQKSNANPKGIEWTHEDLLHIFNRLKSELVKIEKNVLRDERLFNYSSILQEMIHFLDSNNLQNLVNDYWVVKQKVQLLYNRERGYATLQEGLSSSEQAQVIWALSELSKDLYQYNINPKRLELIQLIINKLLLKSEPGIAASLEYISVWVYNWKDDLKILQDKLLALLKRFKEAPPEDMDKPHTFEQLTRIAYVLKLWGEEQTVVEELLNEMTTSRFNNIRYHLRESLSNN